LSRPVDFVETKVDEICVRNVISWGETRKQNACSRKLAKEQENQLMLLIFSFSGYGL